MAVQRAQCIFCKVVDGLEKSDMLLQNENICVFRDIRPSAKNHILSVPREHYKDAKSLKSDQKQLVQDMIAAANEALTALGDDLSDVQYGFHWPPFHSVAHLHLHAISPASQMSFISRMIFRPNSYWFVSPDYVLSQL